MIEREARTGVMAGRTRHPDAYPLQPDPILGASKQYENSSGIVKGGTRHVDLECMVVLAQ